jgi:uncharacterized protein (TIGR00725 family)
MELAKREVIMICGGLRGVMEGAAKGVREAGGITIGIVPGENKQSANPYIDIVIATNMGHARNIILAHTCDGGIAVTGSLGTLSEIAITLKLGKPIVGLNSWNVDPRIIPCDTPVEAVDKIIELIGT